MPFCLFYAKFLFCFLYFLVVVSLIISTSSKDLFPKWLINVEWDIKLYSLIIHCIFSINQQRAMAVAEHSWRHVSDLLTRCFCVVCLLGSRRQDCRYWCNCWSSERSSISTWTRNVLIDFGLLRRCTLQKLAFIFLSPSQHSQRLFFASVCLLGCPLSRICQSCGWIFVKFSEWVWLGTRNNWLVFGAIWIRIQLFFSFSLMLQSCPECLLYNACVQFN